MDNNKLKSPKPDDLEFTYYWDLFLPDIENRENLKPTHLLQLRLLCDLSVEVDYLQNFLNVKGKTYESHGRNGMQIKPRPEVQMLKSAFAEVRAFSKLLGLTLVKDTEATNGKKTKNEFQDDDDE